MQVDRRSLVGSLLAASLVGVAPNRGLSQDNQFRIIGDDGKPVPNMRVPSHLNVDTLPGVIYAGARSGDVLIVEFTDFNCPYCRRASADIDALLRRDKNIRLALVNVASLSIGSVLAAKVEQAVLKHYGPVRAYEFHRKMFSRRGMNDGLAALQVAQDMKLDRAKIEAEADGDIVRSVVSRHRALADALAFTATPSFIIGSTGILGYPGPKALARIVAEMRKCDRPMC